MSNLIFYKFSKKIFINNRMRLRNKCGQNRKIMFCFRTRKIKYNSFSKFAGRNMNLNILRDNEQQMADYVPPHNEGLQDVNRS